MKTSATAASAARRRFVMASALACVGWPSLGGAASGVGPVAPLSTSPALRLRRHDGATPTLVAQLTGACTAVQLMFTGCSSVCPMQGALFGALQAQLLTQRDNPARLLSLSIDPLADDPPALSAWLRRFDATARWSAAAPDVQALDQLLSLFSRTAAVGDRHSGQVYVFDRYARLAWRTSELPPTAEVLEALRRFA